MPLRLLPLLALLTLSACSGPATAPAAGAATSCALCKKPIPAGVGVQAVVGGKLRDYRCIHCTLTHLQDETGEVEILATTPLDGVDISLVRHANEWTSSPATTVFLILPERADECLDLHQPFATHDEFTRYLAEHPELAAEHPVAFTIAQYEQIVTAGKPK